MTSVKLLRWCFSWHVNSWIPKKLSSYENPNKELHGSKQIKNKKRPWGQQFCWCSNFSALSRTTFSSIGAKCYNPCPQRPKWSVIITDKLFNNMSWQNNFFYLKSWAVLRSWCSHFSPHLFSTVRLNLVTLRGGFSMFPFGLQKRPCWFPLLFSAGLFLPFILLAPAFLIIPLRPTVALVIPCDCTLNR